MFQHATLLLWGALADVGAIPRRRVPGQRRTPARRQRPEWHGGANWSSIDGIRRRPGPACLLLVI